MTFERKKLFLDRRKNVKTDINRGVNTEWKTNSSRNMPAREGMRSPGITSTAAAVSGSSIPGRAIKRLYLFDPSSGIMTERDPLRQDKILRRFVFDRYGMLEETFAFGTRPRTFRYENGARQIAVREGGDYGAVGKIITFEPNGITETAWGRNGEIEHVYQFDAKEDAITIRKGGWYGDVERTIVFAGMGASLFFEPESFLQFLMFSEWSEKDRDEDVNERVSEIRGGKAAAPGTSPFAYTGAAVKGKAAPRHPGSSGRTGRPPVHLVTIPVSISSPKLMGPLLKIPGNR